MVNAETSPDQDIQTPMCLLCSQVEIDVQRPATDTLGRAIPYPEASSDADRDFNLLSRDQARGCRQYYYYDT